MIKGITAGPSMNAELHKERSLARLKSTCAEFESIFINYMLKSMRSTMNEHGLLENTNESRIINAMFDENLAQGIAAGGGIGLGQILFERLKDQK
jgi:flagellar protein FlgJ